MILKKIKVAIAGNPNSGKTPPFNAITGARQHTGNWPGVTVEKKEGTVRLDGHEIHMVDLPGTYSLTAYSLEERLVRNLIIESKPDVLVNVVDLSNLDRNLYLTVQLLEMGVKVIIALNMMDVAQRRGIKVDENEHSELLKVRVILTNAKKGIGTKEILNQAIALAKAPVPLNGRGMIPYGAEVEVECAKIEEKFDIIPKDYDGLPNQWLAVKLLENDKEITKAFSDKSAKNGVPQQVQESRNRIDGSFGDTPEIVLTNTRYTFISKIIKQSVQIDKSDRVTVSESIDKVLTHRLFEPMILLAALYLVYMFTFQGSEPLVNSVEGLFSWIGGLVGEALSAGSLQSLVVSGIIHNND